MHDHSDIGISTGAYRGMPLEVALERIALLAPMVEIGSFGGHSLLESRNARVIAAVNLPFTVHGPFLHVDARGRSSLRVATDVHRRHMEAAAELGADLYVVHPDMQRRARPWSRRIAAALERQFAELRVLQDELGLTVAVENMPLVHRSHFTTPGDVDLQGLGLALDVGHAAVSGTLAEWLAYEHAPLLHMHLHDNRGHRTGDHHLPLGAGVLDAAPVLEVARAAGATIVLEHVTEADVLLSLEHLRARGLLGEPAG